MGVSWHSQKEQERAREFLNAPPATSEARTVAAPAPSASNRITLKDPAVLFNALNDTHPKWSDGTPVFAAVKDSKGSQFVEISVLGKACVIGNEDARKYLDAANDDERKAMLPSIAIFEKKEVAGTVTLDMKVIRERSAGLFEQEPSEGNAPYNGGKKRAVVGYAIMLDDNAMHRDADGDAAYTENGSEQKYTDSNGNTLNYDKEVVAPFVAVATRRADKLISGMELDNDRIAAAHFVSLVIGSGDYLANFVKNYLGKGERAQKELEAFMRAIRPQDGSPRAISEGAIAYNLYNFGVYSHALFEGTKSVQFADTGVRFEIEKPVEAPKPVEKPKPVALTTEQVKAFLLERNGSLREDMVGALVQWETGGETNYGVIKDVTKDGRLVLVPESELDDLRPRYVSSAFPIGSLQITSIMSRRAFDEKFRNAPALGDEYLLPTGEINEKQGKRIRDAIASSDSARVKSGALSEALDKSALAGYLADSENRSYAYSLMKLCHKVEHRQAKNGDERREADRKFDEAVQSFKAAKDPRASAVDLARVHAYLTEALTHMVLVPNMPAPAGVKYGMPAMTGETKVTESKPEYSPKEPSEGRPKQVLKVVAPVVKPAPTVTPTVPKTSESTGEAPGTQQFPGDTYEERLQMRGYKFATLIGLDENEVIPGWMSDKKFGSVLGGALETLEKSGKGISGDMSDEDAQWYRSEIQEFGKWFQTSPGTFTPQAVANVLGMRKAAPAQKPDYSKPATQLGDTVRITARPDSFPKNIVSGDSVTTAGQPVALTKDDTKFLAQIAVLKNGDKLTGDQLMHKVDELTIPQQKAVIDYLTPMWPNLLDIHKNADFINTLIGIGAQRDAKMKELGIVWE